jgi:hypothetical protein
VLRIYSRLSQLEHAYSDLRSRVKVVEDRSRPAPLKAERRTTQSGSVDTRSGNQASAFATRQAAPSRRTPPE